MLGADVSWDDTNRVATGIAPGISVQIPIDSDVIYRSTIEIPTDSPATIIDGRTLIPLRVVSECFGMNVSYDESTHTVNITNKNSMAVIIGIVHIHIMANYPMESRMVMVSFIMM